MNVQTFTNTDAIAQTILDTIMDNDLVMGSAHHYARKELGIATDFDVSQDERLEKSYYVHINQFLMVTLGKVIARLAPTI